MIHQPSANVTLLISIVGSVSLGDRYFEAEAKTITYSGDIRVVYGVTAGSLALHKVGNAFYAKLDRLNPSSAESFCDSFGFGMDLELSVDALHVGADRIDAAA